MKEKAIIKYVSIVILTIGAILITSHGIHRYKIKRSEFRFTVAEVTGYSSKGTSTGKSIRYNFRGKIYDNFCASQECKTDINTGEKYFIKVYIDDPEIFEILYSKKIFQEPSSIPFDGWTKLPPNKF